jgi:cytochrome c-type biogenesis protein
MGMLTRGQNLRLLCALVLAGCDGAVPPPVIGVGSPVPVYGAAILYGDTVALASLSGDAVLLNVWATWCAPCRYEMPGLQALHEEYASQGLRVLGVSIDARRADTEVRAFTREVGVTFPILLDPEGQVTRSFQMTGVPETFLIDRRGQIVRRWVGIFDPTSSDTRASVVQALGNVMQGRL